MTVADLPFLAAIRAAPGDPQPHTIYADWLFDQPGRAPEAALRYVLLEPGDDSHRLAYADRLEETSGVVECSACDGHGWFGGVNLDKLEPYRRTCEKCGGTGTVSDGRRGRAEFVRVQCELAQPHECPGTSRNPDRCGYCFGTFPPESCRVERYRQCAYRAALRRREREIVWKYGQSWVEEILARSVK